MRVEMVLRIKIAEQHWVFPSTRLISVQLYQIAFMSLHARSNGVSVIIDNTYLFSMETKFHRN